MKKLILLIAIFFSITSAFAQVGSGELEGSQTVYTGSNFTYLVDVKQHNPGSVDDTYVFEIFDNIACITPVTDVTSVIKANYIKDLDGKIGVTVTWLKKPVGDIYYLRVKQTGANACFNLKTFAITVTDPVGSMDFVFTDIPASSSDCAANLSGSDLDLNVTLSGVSVIHETGRPAQVFYAITTTNGTDVVGKFANVNTTVAKGAGDYTFTIPKAELMLDAGDLTTDGVFSISVTKLKDGAGTEIDLVAAQVYTFTAHGLPVISTITIK